MPGLTGGNQATESPAPRDNEPETQGHEERDNEDDQSEGGNYTASLTAAVGTGSTFRLDAAAKARYELKARLERSEQYVHAGTNYLREQAFRVVKFVDIQMINDMKSRIKDHCLGASYCPEDKETFDQLSWDALLKVVHKTIRNRRRTVTNALQQNCVSELIRKSGTDVVEVLVMNCHDRTNWNLLLLLYHP